MCKYSKQFKLKVVKEFLKSGGLKRVSHLFEISHSDVRKWALAYQAHGHSGLNPSHQRHSPQFKVQVLEYMAQHQISARPAAAHFGIGSMTDLLPQTGQLSTRKIDGVVELQNDLANIAGGRSPSDECGLKQL